MTRKTALLLMCAVFCIGAAAQTQKNNATGICPEPVWCEVDRQEYLPLKKVSVACEDGNAVAWAEKHLKEWYGKEAPSVAAAVRETDTPSEEAYELETGGEEVRITARTLQGVRYALYSLRQMAIPERGTKEVSGWIVPKATIKDSPALPFRGIHMCWFHETKPWEVERFIRLA
ncbi:MAG: glycoside hydrolase family 20 zincin-like fold domain-containing protein, partial [Bacteroidales bacterium]|nr:glycoside hydrolase family 20 zincin-like fold domain-containing protein [Bacteroidales bacterium]